MPTIKYKNILSLILVFNIFALTAAYFIQYVLGHQPCKLCLIERIPFMIVITIISFCLIFKKFEKLSLVFLSLIFFLTAILSFYHFGIEKGFIEESLVCSLEFEKEALTKKAILEQLKEGVTRCKDVTFKILGLSLATINIFISIILCSICLKLFLNYEKNK